MTEGPLYRVLFLCTGNSARSQIAEALLNARGGGRFLAESAGTHPATEVHPGAIRVLADAGIPWRGHPPRSIDGLEREAWDFVITVCDHAKEHCPLFPGRPTTAHWGLPDPASVTGSEAERRRAFEATREALERRIARLVALPLERMDRAEATTSIREIGEDG
jgi:arsenate reductase